MKETNPNRLSQEASQVLEMINDLAVEFMFCQYENLSPGMKMRLAEVTKNTQRMMDGDLTGK